FFFSSRRRHTRFDCDWSSDVCSSDLGQPDNRSCVSDVDPLRIGSGRVEGNSERRIQTGGKGRNFLRVSILRDSTQDLDRSRVVRSEERRVGKECRAGWGWYELKREMV